MTRPSLLLVHGRGQGEFDTQALLDLWMQSLSIGMGPQHEGILAEVEVQLPFYGHRLDELLQAAGGLPQFPQHHRDHAPQLREFESFQHAHIREVQERHGLTNEKLEALGNEPGEAPAIRGLPWVHSVLRALDKIPGLSGEMLERLTHDVWLYMRDAWSDTASMPSSKPASFQGRMLSLSDIRSDRSSPTTYLDGGAIFPCPCS
ncbi:hypothetical protein AAG593_00595 [Citromicrobium bathyomarinum]